MPKIFVTNKLFASELIKNLKLNFIFITITTPPDKYDVLKKPDNEYCKGYIDCYFDDVDIKYNDDITLFDKDIAHNIVSKLSEYLNDNIKIILINCDAGISRSAAVGMALNDIMYTSKDNLHTNTAGDFSLYNRFVYKTLIDEYYNMVRDASNSNNYNLYLGDV